jgi:hypothetical protein
MENSLWHHNKIYSLWHHKDEFPILDTRNFQEPPTADHNFSSGSKFQSTLLGLEISKYHDAL